MAEEEVASDDWEIEKTEDSPEDEAEPSLEYEIMNFPADITLGGYVEYDDKEQLEVPPFQRMYVWDRVKASKLVESFLLGLPVPGTFLYKRKNSSSYLIIDGQQRIKSVIRYIRGTFDEKVFRLKNVDPRYENKTFSELSEDDQFRLTGSVLRATIIQQINPLDDTSIYHVFERLNTGGVNLNPMEVRQCVSYGPFIEGLKQINEVDSWRKIIGKPMLDKRLRDVELVLRCLALSETGEEYEKPMKGFLNQYAEEMRNKQDEIEGMVDNFTQTCDQILEALGEKPFHLRGRLNYGALDSVFSTLLKFEQPDDFAERFQNLLEDDDYQESITYNTSDESVVSVRLQKAQEVLLG
ncbi:DUF262 domain-containing protein [Parasphingorhabdus halotolerans]|uniref:DUF262 domain-containing protein n=1 Tax=Parasphingorhabdus halotolerans TaxID=2725558 RepID=A0A6H2DHR3_9SPHN|nr:DUF262 domain-containing protein [Parasphingorhabdus halotolerans]QJB68209.1 DUF262 domain-containing protein [Parasphingorhabdus halotolerans]